MGSCKSNYHTTTITTNSLYTWKWNLHLHNFALVINNWQETLIFLYIFNKNLQNVFYFRNKNFNQIRTTVQIFLVGHKKCFYWFCILWSIYSNSNHVRWLVWSLKRRRTAADWWGSPTLFQIDSLVSGRNVKKKDYNIRLTSSDSKNSSDPSNIVLNKSWRSEVRF